VKKAWRGVKGERKDGVGIETKSRWRQKNRKISEKKKKNINDISNRAKIEIMTIS